jgi:hypothetical protein
VDGASFCKRLTSQTENVWPRSRRGADHGRGWEKTLWKADDGALKADGEKVPNFWQAKAAVLKLAGKKPEIPATLLACADEVIE